MTTVQVELSVNGAERHAEVLTGRALEEALERAA